MATTLSTDDSFENYLSCEVYNVDPDLELDPEPLELSRDERLILAIQAYHDAHVSLSIRQAAKKNMELPIRHLI
jgi:hypothetical protein